MYDVLSDDCCDSDYRWCCEKNAVFMTGLRDSGDFAILARIVSRALESWKRFWILGNEKGLAGARIG